MKKREDKNPYLKMESIGENGVSLEYAGDNKEIQVKFFTMLNSLLLAEVISTEELMFITMEVIKYHKAHKDKHVEKIELENATEEEVNAVIEQFMNKRKKPAPKKVRLKCLVCPEKDTCENKWLDVKCNKY